MIVGHDDPIPPGIMATIRAQKTQLMLEERLRQASHGKPSEQVCLVVLGTTDRDAFFYHFFLCSILAYCSRIPRIAVFIDDLRGKESSTDDLVSHHRWQLSDIVGELDDYLRVYARNPFFYRIAGLLILDALGVSFSQVLVSDNDILIRHDLSNLESFNLLCKHNSHDDSDALVRLLARDLSDLPDSFFHARIGSYSDFFLALRNTVENRTRLANVCKSGLPQQIPTSSYYYWWLSWLGLVNSFDKGHFEALTPVSFGRKTYCLRGTPILYHVGGGYEKQKARLFTRELLGDPNILGVSPVSSRLLQEWVCSLPLSDDLEDWLHLLEPGTGSPQAKDLSGRPA